MLRSLSHLLPLVCLVLFTAPARAIELPVPNAAELAWLGERIYTNECNRQRDCLLSWNAGEDFPSLGIGHFIWYRRGQQEAFAETFPDLLRFLEEQGHTLPAWLREAGYNQPWPDRQSFLAARNGPELGALTTLLEETMPEQTDFIVQRLATTLPALLAAASQAERDVLELRIRALLAQDLRLGYYALVDYLHFKGDGGQATERYQGQGWGLLQVLQGMADDTPALQAFVTSARTVLERRVALAPPERNEQRWLAGWHNRLQTYLPAP